MYECASLNRFLISCGSVSILSEMHDVYSQPSTYGLCTSAFHCSEANLLKYVMITEKKEFECWLSPGESAYVTIAHWLVHHVETQMKR